MPDSSVRKGRVPVDLVAVAAGAGALAFVICAGAGLSSVLPQPSLWFTAAAYLAPAGLAFAAYWWIAQRG